MLWEMAEIEWMRWGPIFQLWGLLWFPMHNSWELVGEWWVVGPSAGLTTRLTRLQPRAPDFLGAPERPRPRKGLNEFSLMCEIREIMKIVLVQFYQIYYLISLFNYI